MCVGPTLGFRFRLFGQVAPIVRQLVELESPGGLHADAGRSGNRGSDSFNFADLDVRKNAWALGQDAAFAAPMAKAHGAARDSSALFEERTSELPLSRPSGLSTKVPSQR